MLLLLPLLLEATLLCLASSSHHPFYNGFYYNHIMNDKGNGQEKGTSGMSRKGGLVGWCKGLKCLPLSGWGWDPSYGGVVGPRGAGRDVPGVLG